MRVGIAAGLAVGLACGVGATDGDQRRLIVIAGQSNAQTWIASSGLSDASYATTYPAVTHLTKQDSNTDPPVWTETTPASLAPVFYGGANKIGLEASLMRTLDAAAPGQFVVAQYALGGTSLAVNWLPTGTYPSLDPPNLFTQFVAWVRAAEISTNSKLAAVVWNQGETDAGTLAFANAYEANLTALIAAVRSNLRDVPFVFGQLNSAYVLGSFTSTVRAAQAAVDAAVSRTTMVNQDSQSIAGDGQHYTADGFVALGKLYAAAVAPLIGVNIPPTAAFTSSTSTLTATFTDTSTDLDGTIVAWAWTFGDGATSALQNPSRTYASAGTYTVTLTVTDSGGQIASKASTVTVSASAWTVDATSSKGRPATGAEFAAFLAANSGTLSAWSSPTSLYTCQDAASPLADQIGAFSLAMSGTGDAYQQAISGWDAKAATLTDGTAAGWRSLSASLPDISTTSILVLAYVRMPASAPAATRILALVGGAVTANVRLVGGTGVFSTVSGANAASGATNMAGAGVVPVVLKVDRTGSIQTAYSLSEKLSPTFGVTMTGKSAYLGSNGAAAAVGYLWAARWDGAAAERTDAQIKALLQALAWSPTWT
jgi:PKD repeat protein